MRTLRALMSALVLCGTTVFAQERSLLPPPPPMRNPMLMQDKALPLPPSLGAPVAEAEREAPGWIMRRKENGKWQVLWMGRWVGKNQMMGDERITNIDAYGIEVKGANGKRSIPVVGVNLSRQQKDKK